MDTAALLTEKLTSHVAFRRGVVCISNCIIREHPETLLPLMARIVVLGVTRDEFNDSIKYLCVSPDFELWNPIECMEPPQYTATMKREDDGKTVLMGWRKQ